MKLHSICSSGRSASLPPPANNNVGSVVPMMNRFQRDVLRGSFLFQLPAARVVS